MQTAPSAIGGPDRARSRRKQKKLMLAARLTAHRERMGHIVKIPVIADRKRVRSSPPHSLFMIASWHVTSDASEQAQTAPPVARRPSHRGSAEILSRVQETGRSLLARPAQSPSLDCS